MQQSSYTLDEVKSYFEHWRATRTKKRERIPVYLWDEVKTLIGQYSLLEITQALRINTGQMKDNLRSSFLSTKINFVEAKSISPSSRKPFLSFSDNKQTCSIELHRTNGVVLKISALPVISLQNLIAQLKEIQSKQLFQKIGDVLLMLLMIMLLRYLDNSMATKLQAL